MFPDFAAALLLIVGAYILRRREDSFRNAYVPSAFYLLLSLSTLYNFLPKEQNAGWAAVYAAACALTLAAECAAYKKCFDAFCEMYQNRDRGGYLAVAVYALCRTVGIAVSLLIYLTPEDTVSVTAAYFAWAAINIVVSTYLVYRFYLQKPKFH